MSRRLNDDWHRVDPTNGKPLATKAEIANNLEELGRHKAASTTSNNIDTELLEASSNIKREIYAAITSIIAFKSSDYEVLEKLVNRTLGVIAADRDKLIKHLAYEMGQNYEAMVKIARTMK